MKEPELRPFGNTGLLVSRLGIGLAALGRPAYINIGHHTDLEGHRDVAGLSLHTQRVLDVAHATGVRYFDVARSYGKSEEFLARWIEGREGTLHDTVVASKWGYNYVGDWQLDVDVHEVKDHSLPTLDRQFHETLAVFAGDLDVYQIHSATEDSGVLDNAEILIRLGEMRDEGLVVGLTVSGPDQATTIRHAMSIKIDGRPLFGTVQATWNVLEPSTGDVLAEAHDAGMGVIVKEALANGRLTDSGSEAAMTLQHAVRDVPRDAAALAIAMAQPWADVVLSGAATEAQAHSNALALDLTADFDLPDMAEPPAQYWTRRAMLPWT